MIEFNDYANPTLGKLERDVSPSCRNWAVIPSITVKTVAGMKDLGNCFVHVDETNTTYYVDEKQHYIVTWAGPVEVDNYDAATNPLNLRSQTCYDFVNNKAYYFNKLGAYRTITLGA